MNKLRFGAIFIIGFMCLVLWTENVLAFDTIISYPLEWPEVSSVKTECVSLDGVYHSLGSSNSTLSERFQKPIFERNFLGEEEIAAASNTFSIEKIKKENRLNFRVYESGGKLILEKNIGIEFRCDNTWIVYETASKGGTGESPHIEASSVTKMSRAVDGSLIINTVTKNVSRKWIFGRETKVSDIWYRYLDVSTENIR